MFRGVARSHRRCIDVVATQSTMTETGTSELIVDYILVVIVVTLRAQGLQQTLHECNKGGCACPILTYALIFPLPLHPQCPKLMRPLLKLSAHTAQIQTQQQPIRLNRGNRAASEPPRASLGPPSEMPRKRFGNASEMYRKRFGTAHDRVMQER